MGCTASKLDNEDTVRRCKERRRLIKEAVYSRHHLATAHSDYCRSLRLTGSALSVFAAGEPLSISEQTPPAVLLRKPSSISSASFSSVGAATNHFPPRVPPSPTIGSSKLPHILSASSSQKQYSVPYDNKKKQSLPHILSESSSTSFSPPNNIKFNNFHKDNFTHETAKRNHPKLPHILSESSLSSTPRSNKSNFFNNDNFVPNATYASTPSQASSVWNWENFYPPSPPSSEFFERKFHKDHDNLSNSQNRHHLGGHHDDRDDDGETEVEEGTDYLREEVHCSDWGDHYSTTSSSTSDDVPFQNDHDEVASRSDYGFSSIHRDEEESMPKRQQTKNKYHPTMSDKSEEVEEADGSSSVTYGGANDMKIVVRHKDLAEIVAAIKENFDMAAEAGERVSEMLETGRAQLDRSFRQLKKTVYHSSGVLSNLSSSWTSKPPLAVKYRLDASSLDQPGGPKSLCSTLERLLAWEKKLYEEVKAREGVKIEHEKKLATLQSQEYKGDDEVKLDKTKASIRKLQSLIIVTSQAVSTTSTAIVGLRDSDLVPHLGELCHSFMYMWRSMNQYHEIQNQIVQQVRGLVNRASKGDSTSDLHRQATRDLESAVSIWHSSFCRLVKFQRDFIQSLHGWFKLSLLPVDNEQTNASAFREPSDAFGFCDEWKLALDRLPDTVASEAINSFVNVVHVISVKQSEELKIKKRTETACRELEKKASSLRTIEKKYYHSYSMVGIGLPDTGPDNGHLLDARDPLAEKKSELAGCQRRVEDEMFRHSKSVEVTRAMTLNNLQTGLPGVFQAMASFSALFVEALESVCTRSYAIK